MGFLDEVGSGEHGVLFSPPADFELISESDLAVLLLNRSGGFGLQLSWCGYRLDLMSDHKRLLRLDLERQTRDLFLQFWERRTREGLPRDRHRLHSDDPGWSPLIEANTLNLRAVPALEALHRLAYEPGCEIVMGHLLIPVMSGLFEFRVTASSETTGTKESILVAQVLQRPDLQEQLRGSESGDALEQALQGKLPNIDDPTLDERFPAHPLAVVRRGQKWLRENAQISVIAPAVVQSSGEVAIPLMQCALIPPPRYLLHEESQDRAQFSRVSFATTDGISLMTLVRLPESMANSSAKSQQLAEEIVRARVPDKSTDVEVTSRLVAGRDGNVGAEAQMRFTRTDCFPGRTFLRLFQDKLGKVWFVIIETSQSVPTSEIADELAGVVRSFRLTSKPSWKFW
jgi:hypothetical protein